jgi:hypothetical protein
MIRRKIAAGLAAAIVTTVGLTAVPSAAQAGWSDCPAGALCAYTATDGGGAPGKVTGDNADLLQYSKFNNAASLYNNGRNCNVAVYSKKNWTGTRKVLDRGDKQADLDSLWNKINGWSDLYKNVASNDWCV